MFIARLTFEGGQAALFTSSTSKLTNFTKNWGKLPRNRFRWRRNKFAFGNNFSSKVSPKLQVSGLCLIKVSGSSRFLFPHWHLSVRVAARDWQNWVKHHSVLTTFQFANLSSICLFQNVTSAHDTRIWRVFSPQSATDGEFNAMVIQLQWCAKQLSAESWWTFCWWQSLWCWTAWCT